MDTRPLGDSGIEVSVLSLGSWRTYQRIPRAQAMAVSCGPGQIAENVAATGPRELLDTAVFEDLARIGGAV